MSFVLALLAGLLIGSLYAALRVKSPAPPIAALFGLFGIWLAQNLLGAIT
jgi:XapX domain-containing protein